MNEPTKTQEFDEKKIKDILKCLKTSATFNMSRGGRELFHTNFLAFILDAEYTGDNCQSYEAQVKKLILEQLFCSGKVPENVITFRERSNLDLIVIPALNELNDVKKVVVIEAKLKSIPTVKQLEKYNKKFEKGLTLELFDELEFKMANRHNEDYDFNICGINVKLSKTIPNNCAVSFIDSGCKHNDRPREVAEVTLKRLLLAPESISTIEPKPWILVDWFIFLENIKPKENAYSPKEKSIFGLLIEDYLDSTKLVLSLVQQVNERAQLFLQEKITWNDFFTFAVNRSDFKNVRLHDLVGKVAYHTLQNKLIGDLELDEKLKKTVNGFSLDTYTFYSRSQPGIGIQYKMSKGKKAFCLGIQLQGNNYRHFIERNNCTDLEPNLIACAEIIKDWICINKNKQEKMKNNGFGVFDKTKFVYQHTILEVNNTDNLNKSECTEESMMYGRLLDKFKSSLMGAILEIEKQDFLSKFVDKAAEDDDN